MMIPSDLLRNMAETAESLSKDGLSLTPADLAIHARELRAIAGSVDNQLNPEPPSPDIAVIPFAARRRPELVRDGGDVGA